MGSYGRWVLFSFIFVLFEFMLIIVTPKYNENGGGQNNTAAENQKVFQGCGKLFDLTNAVVVEKDINLKQFPQDNAKQGIHNVKPYTPERQGDEDISVNHNQGASVLNVVVAFISL